MSFALTLIFELIALFVLIIIAVLAVLFTVPNFFSAPWVPTNKKVGRKLLKLAKIKPGETIIDFGSGDAALLILAAKEFKAKGIGIEHNFVMCLVARIRLRLSGLSDQVKIIRGDFTKVDLPQADVIVSYLFPQVQAKLEPFLIQSYPSGTRLVCHAFRYPNLKLIQEIEDKKDFLYLYQIP